MNPFDVTSILGTAGLIGLLTIVFVETGLLVGFVLPGDSLLFTAGVFAAQPKPFASIWLLVVLIPLAAILGDQAGFFIGRKVGPAILHSQAARWIGPEQIERTDRFFEKYGARTVLIARFIAIVRTLTPVMAGVSSMPYRRFTAYSIAGSILWGSGVTALGYFLGGIPLIRDHIELIMIGAIAVVLLPTFTAIGIRWWRTRGAEDAEIEIPDLTVTRDPDLG